MKQATMNGRACGAGNASLSIDNVNERSIACVSSYRIPKREGSISETDIAWLKDAITDIKNDIRALKQDHRDVMNEISLVRSRVSRLEGAQYILVLLMVAIGTKYLFFS